MTTTTNHSHDPLAERVLGRIESEHVIPRPRWEFLLKNYSFWTFGALAVVFGALAFAATLFEVTAVDWRFGSVTHTNSFAFFLAAAPLLWIIALTLFILIGYANIRWTNHGYRYPLWLIALGAMLTSLALGSGLFFAGLGGPIDEAIGDHPPFYRPIVAAQRAWWLAPQKGLLTGKVIALASSTSDFVLRDLSGHSWQVNGSELQNQDLSAVAQGREVRVVGLPVGQAEPIASTSPPDVHQASTSVSATSPAVFHACFVLPWKREKHRPGFPPPPFASTSISEMKKSTSTSSDLCKGIRPYQQLRALDEGADK